jgi:hypothetical protein
LAGFTDADLQKTLIAAGWSAQDVSAAFAALSTPASVMPPPVIAPAQPAPVITPTIPTSNVSEEARIQEELRKEELRQSNQLVAGSSTNKSAKGMAGFLISKNIVQSESQANILLVGIILLALFGTWFFWPA